MNITIIQGAFLPVPPALGGAVEKMWFALGKEFVKKGHQVTHISRMFNQFPQQEVIDGVSHKRVKGFATPASGIYLKWLDFRYTIKAQSYIPADSDVVVTNTFWGPLLIKNKFKKRCFVDVQRMPKGQMRWYKNAGRLRANSNVVATAIKQEIPASLYEKVVMVPNPLPFATHPTIHHKNKKPVLLYVGRIHPEKGLELLIQAYKKITADWPLIIVGPHDVAAGGGGEAYLQSLKQLVGELPIHFTGPVYDAALLNTYYQEASIFIYPSVAEKGETFGLAPLEAMALGCVPVVSGLECFQDFIVHGLNGLIFNHRAGNAVELLSNTISTLINDAAYTAKLADKAVLVNQSHSISAIGARFLEEFQQLIRSN